MSVVLRTRTLKNSSKSYYLDIHVNGSRYAKWLGIIISSKPKDEFERIANKEKLLLAQRALRDMELELLSHDFGVEVTLDKKNQSFTEFYEEYINECLLADKRSYEAALKKLRLFAKKSKIYPHEINEAFLQRFKKYLDSHLFGETSYNYFKKVARIIKEATKAKLFKVNPATNIVNKKKPGKEKDVLSVEEIQLLVQAPCPNSTVKHAFLFSCLTGLRFCDVKELRWKNVKSDYIDIVQKKTRKRVIVHLNKDSLKLLGEWKTGETLVFDLPTSNGSNKSIKKWMENAGITKHITWHCGRHSFGTNLINSGADLGVVSGLLGHTSYKETARYLRIKSEIKQKAVDSLPSIF